MSAVHLPGHSTGHLLSVQLGPNTSRPAIEVGVGYLPARSGWQDRVQPPWARPLQSLAQTPRQERSHRVVGKRGDPALLCSVLQLLVTSAHSPPSFWFPKVFLRSGISASTAECKRCLCPLPLGVGQALGLQGFQAYSLLCKFLLQHITNIHKMPGTSLYWLSRLNRH